MTEQHEHATGPGEPLVTLCGPFYVGDVVDLATGLRFRGGKASGVPESLATKYAEERTGYYVEPNIQD